MIEAINLSTFPVNGQYVPEPKQLKFTTPRTSQQRLSDALNQPPINKMLGDIWLSGELHLLFADTGVGKSILAVTISDALSKGDNVMFLENECDPLVVLYYDFELSDRQFLKRYSNENSECHSFSQYFYIDNIEFDKLLEVGDSQSFEKSLFSKIRHDVKTLNANVLIIDNITYLKTQTTQKTDSALELMRELIALKKELNISILVLAHTPKIDLSSPLTINSLAGSKHLSNFADSVSAIGFSTQGDDIRYFKQIKVRSAELLYGGNSVMTCRLINRNNFLTYEFINFSNEQGHLKKVSSNDERNELMVKAQELIKNGNSYSEVAEILLGDSRKKGTIHKWVKAMNVSPVSSVSNEFNGNAGNGGNE